MTHCQKNLSYPRNASSNLSTFNPSIAAFIAAVRCIADSFKGVWLWFYNAYKDHWYFVSDHLHNHVIKVIFFNRNTLVTLSK